MPSSGTGNSFNNDYVRCQQYFYNKHRQGLVPHATAQAAPTAVGTAIHDSIAAFLVGQVLGLTQPQCVERMFAEYDALIREAVPPGSEDSLSAITVLERAEVGRAVLSTWAPQQWDRLASGEERTLAVEWSAAFTLPRPEIRPELQLYTVRLDHVYRLPDGTVCIRDWKSTRANKPSDEVRNYLMSDQHLGYAWAWQQVHPQDEVYTIEYSMLRLHPKVISKDAFHSEPRPVVPEQLQDWYERMLAQRVEMSAKWDAPRTAWLSNTSSHGPCMVYGRECEYGRLCRRPWEREQLIEGYYEQSDG